MGKGIRYHNRYTKLHLPKTKYKVSPNGLYGNLLIDLNKLYNQNKLVAKNQKTGKEVINTKVDDDLIDLINKRYNNNKKHSILSRKIFKELTEKSGLPKVIRGEGFNSSLCTCNPEELISNLGLICGSIDAGNNNEELKNEGISKIDELLKMNKELPEQHEMLYKNIFLELTLLLKICLINYI